MKNHTKHASTSDMMDPQVAERKVGTDPLPRQRNCYALTQLIDEFTALFPETPIVVKDRDGRGVAFTVEFNLEYVPRHESLSAGDLLLSTVLDPRVAYVNRDAIEANLVEITIARNARTQDSREEFGLADAWELFNPLADESLPFDEEGSL